MRRSRHTTVFYFGLVLLLASVVTSTILTRSGGPRHAALTEALQPALTVAEPEKAEDKTTEGGKTEDNGEPAVGPEFDAAAAENARLKTELEWNFGGKSQRGWYIYTPLIQWTLGTNKEPDAGGFAQALARWQKSSGINPTGILDRDTLTRMIGFWQSRRLKDHTVAAPNRLLTVQTSDFYDPSRAEELRKVEPQTYAAYKRMVAAAASDSSLGLQRARGGELAESERYLKIVSAFRSPEYQEKLRQQSPNSGPAGLAKNSPHFTGRALDLYVGGEP
ncbi:MAG TPA: M15 family metallopeptidase, partial [Pyrinomonadaceae bacterium]